MSALLLIPVGAEAESAAAKNGEGNRLYSKGRYEEAEKAYLEAHGQSPGKPEILYNLGNSLIRQGKYPQGIQSLRQSAGSGNDRLKADSLYNSGNALYSAGDFRGAADAFIEALKLDPEDADAKHNLELALRQIEQQKQDQGQDQKQEQEQKESDQNKGGQKQDDRSDAESPQSKENRDQPGDRDGKDTKTENGREEPKKMQPPQGLEREGSITREQALKILDAIQNQELEQQRKKIESLSRSGTGARDW